LEGAAFGAYRRHGGLTCFFLGRTWGYRGSTTFGDGKQGENRGRKREKPGINQRDEGIIEGKHGKGEPRNGG